MHTRRVWLVLMGVAVAAWCSCAPRYTSRVPVTPEPQVPTSSQEVQDLLERAEASYERGVDSFVEEDYQSAAAYLEEAVSLLSRDLDWSAREEALTERRLLLYKCRYFLERIPATIAEGSGSGPWNEVQPKKPPLPPVEIVHNSRVDKWVRYFTGEGREAFDRWVTRSGKYREVTRRILREEGLPLELENLALIESGFNPQAYSRAHAVGMWQFIESTGKIYGLRIDWWVDERRDPEKSTRAAARHLRDLYEALDSWPLALAAYNWGQRKVEKAMAKGHTRDYWDLRLARETRDYVPKFLAACIIMADPSSFGFSFQYESPLRYEEIEVEPKTDFGALAQCCGVSKSVIKDLNPHLIRDCAPDGKSFCAVRIPSGMREACKVALLQIPRDQRIAQSFASPSVKHKVRRGETLSKIARDYGVSIQDLVAANNISNRNRIRVGQVLTVPGGEYQGGYENPGIHTVKSHETLSSIAKRYGLRVSDLVSWNNLRSANIIYPGQTLVLTPAGSYEGPAFTHRVRPGETLSGIAARYERSLKEIMDANELSSPHRIYPGQTIKIPGQVAGETSVHKVKAGETITAIAKLHGASVDAVLDANQLGPRDSIYPGQEIVVPGSSYEPSGGSLLIHEVQPGETVYSIAKKYAASWEDVLRTNGLGQKGTIYPGQKLSIAAGATGAASAKIHTVKRGDTVYGIAKRYGVGVNEVLQLNGLRSRDKIYPGQKLAIPLQ